MFGRKCSLCGGNLVGGKCQECGLDNSRKRMYQVDENDYKGNASSYKKAEDSVYGGVSNEDFFGELRKKQDIATQERDTRYRQPQNRQPQNREAYDRQAHNRPAFGRPAGREQDRKNPVSMIKTIILIYILVNVLGVVFSVIASALAF